MLSTGGWIKVCGLVEYEDALAAAAAGADALGFVLAESPRRVRPAELARWSHRLPKEVLRVGVFVDASLADVRRALDEAGLDAVQLHGREDLRAFADLSIPVIKVVSMPVARSERERSEAAISEEWLPRAAALLLDTAVPGLSGGSGRSFAWNEVPRLRQRLGSDAPPLIVAGGLGPENVAAAIEQSGAWGVDVSSGVEALPRTRPPRKDVARIEAFIAAARAAFARRAAASAQGGGE